MKHALVIGGTGMLSNTSLWLVRNGYHVSVIGRNESRMESLIRKTTNPSFITPVLVDYSDTERLQKELRATIERNGPIELVVAWIHSYAEHALDLISKEISDWSNGQWKLFHVLGSSKNLSEVLDNVKIPDSAQYHQVKLGFIIENNRSRWLTNEEISQGVIDSIQKGQSISVVGTIEPWEKRP